MHTVGVDVGGTKVLAGVVDLDGRVQLRLRRETPHRSKSPEVVEDTIAEVVAELADRYTIAAVGIGAAGFVDAAGGTVLFAPHLSWRNEPLRVALKERLGIPVLVDNDANTTAWAEVRFGAGRGHQQALCVTVGTGIGGALVVDGQVFRGAHGLAGEFGHMQVVPNGRRCQCGNRGCWEQYCSGDALVREAREMVSVRSPAAHRLRELVHDDLDQLTGQIVTEAARAGDHSAIQSFGQVGTWLGIGLAGLTAAFDPELIIIGGGLSDAGDLLLGPAREALSQTLTGRAFRIAPAVVRAALGADAGFVGAADLARSLISADRKG